MEQGSIGDVKGSGLNDVDPDYFNYRSRNEKAYCSAFGSVAPLSGATNATVRFSQMAYALKYEHPQPHHDGGKVAAPPVKRRWWETPDLENGDDPSLQAARASDGYRAGLYYNRTEKAAAEQLKTQGLKRVERDLKGDEKFRRCWRWFKGKEEEEEEEDTLSATTTTTTTPTASTFVEETMRRQCLVAREKASMFVRNMACNPKLISKLEKDQESQVYHVPIGEVHDFLMLQWLVSLYDKTLTKAEELYPSCKPVEEKKKKKEEVEVEKEKEEDEDVYMKPLVLPTVDPHVGRNVNNVPRDLPGSSSEFKTFVAGPNDLERL